MNDDLRPDVPATAGQTYDVSQGMFRFAFDANMKSLVIDFMDDLAGNAAQGSLTVYIGTPAGTPFVTVKAGSMVCRPISGSAASMYVTVVPAAGSTGLAHLTVSHDVLPPGRW